MVQKYPDAVRLGKRACRWAELSGKSPYLPALDSFLSSANIAGEFPLGTMDIPVSMIAGNKTESRNNSFALNWMPIMDQHTEFAMKWDSLYNSCVDEGVRDAIECYEYLNHYYVQEGNKRVSVSKYLGIEYIPAQVTRIMPVKTAETRIQVYYEFHDFSRMSHIYDIVLKQRGRYQLLAQMYGQTINSPWTDEATEDLKSAWNQFSRAYSNFRKHDDDYNFGPAFLTYLTIFSPASFESDSYDQIISNIKSVRQHLDSAGEVMGLEFLEEPQKAPEKSGLAKWFEVEKYSKSSPLQFAIIYAESIEHSRWSDSHEAGLLYAQHMIGDNVKGASYRVPAGEDGLSQTLEKAVREGNQVIFTITPDMAMETVRASMKYPDVKFLNCSLALNIDTIRCYNTRMYEATFLMGALAASVLQNMEFSKDQRVIGYLADAPISTTLASVNAFAIGASLIDPSCRISLRWSTCIEDSDYREKWAKEGVHVFSDASSHLEDEPDIFSRLFLKLEDGSRIYLGMPYYSWGRYYARILRTVMDGTYDSEVMKGEKAAASYWYGLSTGVVDIRLGKDIPDQTRKLLAIFKNSMINGTFSPFSGPIVTTDGRRINEEDGNPSELRAQMQTMQVSEIASIDWLNENIDGKIPDISTLNEAGKSLVKIMGN